MLERFDPTPNRNLFRKLEYYFKPYNNEINTQKHMVFSEDEQEFDYEQDYIDKFLWESQQEQKKKLQYADDGKKVGAIPAMG